MVFTVGFTVNSIFINNHVVDEPFNSVAVRSATQFLALGTSCLPKFKSDWQ